MPDEERERRVIAAIAIVAVLVLAYSLIVAQAPLAALGIVVPLAFLYLAWRFVLAHERIADALEG